MMYASNELPTKSYPEPDDTLLIHSNNYQEEGCPNKML